MISHHVTCGIPKVQRQRNVEIYSRIALQVYGLQKYENEECKQA